MEIRIIIVYDVKMKSYILTKVLTKYQWEDSTMIQTHTRGTCNEWLVK